MQTAKGNESFLWVSKEPYPQITKNNPCNLWILIGENCYLVNPVQWTKETINLNWREDSASSMPP